MSPPPSPPSASAGSGSASTYGDGAIGIVGQRIEDNCQLLTDVPEIYYSTAPPVGTPKLSGTINFSYASLSWPRVTGASKYQVRYSVASSTDGWTQLPSTTSLSQTVRNLQEDTSYYFQVRAHGDNIIRANRWSNWSSSYKATNGPPPAPSLGGSVYSHARD